MSDVSDSENNADADHRQSPMHATTSTLLPPWARCQQISVIPLELTCPTHGRGPAEDRTPQILFYIFLPIHLYSKCRVLYPEGGILSINTNTAPSRTDLIRNSINAEALGSAEEVEGGTITRFIKLQKQLNSASASPPRYDAACKFLDLSSKHIQAGLRNAQAPLPITPSDQLALRQTFCARYARRVYTKPGLECDRKKECEMLPLPKSTISRR